MKQVSGSFQSQQLMLCAHTCAWVTSYSWGFRYILHIFLTSEPRKCSCENLFLQLYVHVRDLHIYRKKSRYFPLAVSLVWSFSLIWQHVQTCVLAAIISCMIVLEYKWIETGCLWLPLIQVLPFHLPMQMYLCILKADLGYWKLIQF